MCGVDIDSGWFLLQNSVLVQVVTFTLHKHFYTFEGEVSGDQNWVKILEWVM
jgi:hypothetical protein